MKTGRNLQRTTHKIILIFYLFVFSALAHEMYLLNSGKNSIDTLPAYHTSGQLSVSVSHLCESFKIDWEWNRFKEKFTATEGFSTLSLIQDNSFYQFNDSVFQFTYAPVRSKGNLYLAIADAVPVFSRFLQKKLVWSEMERHLTVTEQNAAENILIEKEEVENILEEVPKEDQKEIKIVTPEKSTENEKKEVPASKLDLSATDVINVTEPKQKVLTIVIDPGHGGKDPGAIGQNGVYEKDVVLPISLAIRDELKKHKGLKVYMTRSTDKFIPLKKRTEFANKKKADLFISIHANSISGNKKKKSYTKGYKIYFLSQAKNEADKLAAMIENSVIELEEDTEKGDYLQQILTDMANNEFLVESQDISIIISETIGKQVAKIKKLHTGVGQANFWVLNGTFMPSVLVEACFISNPAEEKLLTNKNFQKKLGVAISDAVIQFKDKYEAGL